MTLARLATSLLVASIPLALAGAAHASPEGGAADAVEKPRSGWHDGVFFLRSADDDHRLYVQGRANVDAYVPFGPGVSDLGPGSGLQATVFLRRVRPEISGEFHRVWQYKIEGEWGQSASDNANGQSSTLACAVDATSGAQTCTPRSASVEAPTQKPQALDVYVNYAHSPLVNVQAGQFKIPFTLENRSSENFTPFMEASMPVRALGAPTTRDLGVMAWGETAGRHFYYSAGFFNGDGPNRPNPDGRFDAIGRVFAHPLLGRGTPVDELQVGLSARWGTRDAKHVGYDVSTLTTQGGYAFWKPTYSDSLGRLTHVMPSGSQLAVAGELHLPVSIVELTTEFIYVDGGTREAVDGYQLTPFTERVGTLKGFGYYTQVGVWAMGDRSIVGRRGYSTPTHLDLDKPQAPTKSGLELVAKWEQVQLSYASADRKGSPDARSPDGDIKANAFALGANYWASRNVRLSASYTYYFFPGSEPASQQTSDQRALAPAQGLAKGVDDATRASGHSLHEIMFRLGVAL